MNENAALCRAGRKLSLGVIVELPAGDNVHFYSNACKVKHEIAKQLAGRRMVRKKVSVKNNETFHRVPRNYYFATGTQCAIASGFVDLGEGSSSSILPVRRYAINPSHSCAAVSVKSSPAIQSV
jgi:hypothetical protein